MRLSEVKLGQQHSLPVETGHGPVQTIAVTSGKGGIGKTSIAVNLALALAKEGHRTMLLDADLGMANVDVLLGIHTEVNLVNVLRGEQRLDEIIVNGPDGLMIVPAASGVKQLTELGSSECAGLVRAFSELNHQIDTLVIDTATGISESVASFCGASNEILVIIGNEPASQRDSVALIKLLHSEYAVARFHVLANMVLTAREGSELFKRILELFADEHGVVISYAGYIPYDDALRKAVMHHQAVVAAFPHSRSAMALRHLARRAINWPCPDRARGHLEFFVERLFKQ